VSRSHQNTGSWRRTSAALLALLGLALAACSRQKAPAPVAVAAPLPMNPIADPADGGALAGEPIAAPSEVRAKLLDPTHIGLAWRHNAYEAAGYWIEFATPGSDFTKLEVAWPETTRFQHDDVAPATTFIYRLLPFFGRPSDVVAVRTGPAPARRTGPGAEGPLHEAVPRPTARAATVKTSIRTLNALTNAAPTNLAVRRPAATTAELRWKDNAADEDGYLVEMAFDSSGFKVCALLPADTTSFRKVNLPAETGVQFRVRAFVYGEPTSEVSVTTPSETPSAREIYGRAPARSAEPLARGL
jgi:hypothetical protein